MYAIGSQHIVNTTPKSILGKKASYPRNHRRNVPTKAALTAPLSPATLSDEQRATWAKQIGFDQIGRELPSDVTLSDIVRSLPKEVFEIDHAKSWKSFFLTAGSVALSMYGISICPWYLLPFAWFIAGTAATGLFVVGHDCGHRSFHKNNLVEDMVGNLFMSPLIYPFEPWRILHNQHHAHTNKLELDTAWLPVTWEFLDRMGPVQAFFFKYFLGTPLKLFASIGHWILLHFDITKYNKKQRPAVIVSWLCNALFAVVGLPLLVQNFGLWGLVKFWLMPWLGFHFWLSTFTVVHHTAPHIEFKDESEYNAAKAQLSGTVHCDYPWWVEVLNHDINVHVPHHVSSKIPSYNLRKAHESLKENWGEYMTTCSLNFTMMKWIFAHCHIYDEEKIYVPFDHRKEEAVFALQRKVLGMEGQTFGF
eukprot:TRINITY_DN433_c0_g1_i4.p1 TRINITY_DN433_c0_g1~~TRINITY_DN433_c0_g1_i4.p1  ORF type:complete len:420 (-),score=52.73 TRINITY_DN433_c0_g1_i4:211-1470(-)